jgi:ABC transporter substrate binding protein
MWPRFWHRTSHPHLPQGQRPKTIPVVFVTGADPVKVGLVESLSRPTGNLTGVSVFLIVLGPKHVELLHGLLPSAKTLALLGNPENANFNSEVPDIRAAAETLKQRLEVLTASSESDLEAAFCNRGSTSSRRGPMQVLERQHRRPHLGTGHHPVGQRRQLPATQFLRRQTRQAFVRQRNVQKRREHSRQGLA